MTPTREANFILEEPLRLDNGAELPEVTVRYAVYGELNRERGNAVLVCHALSGSARVADWWDGIFGPDGFDPSRHCIIGTNVIGSCYGSTGPLSIDPRRAVPYGPDFPLVTVRDIVRAHARLLDHLGIARLRAVVGGSIGGMQALQWAVDFPDRVEHCISIGTAPLSAMGLALNHLQRQAIALDPRWSGGRYASGSPPNEGLALARAIAMCSYKSAELFDQRFARKPNRNGEDPCRSYADRFDVAGYLDHQGEKFINRFDANSYFVLSKAMDTFDLARGYKSEAAALGRIRARVLLAGISSDWLFPAEDVRRLAARMRTAGVDCHYAEIVSAHGHDAFLAEPELVKPLLREVLAGTEQRFVPAAATGAGGAEFADSHG